MRTIKLDAIDSTNEFLKRSIKEGLAKDRDAVFALRQTDGKGQMGAKWSSEESKNLTGSILLKFSHDSAPNFFAFNAAVCLAVRKTVVTFCAQSNIEIKWPNDIMAENKKVAGILIENVFSGENEIWTIVGVGLNVNQENFDSLPNATSMKNISGNDYNVDEVFKTLSQNLIEETLLLNQNSVWANYYKYLYRKDKLSKFAYAKDDSEFTGIIVGVSETGKLQVTVNGEILEFANKEITLLRN